VFGIVAAAGIVYSVVTGRSNSIALVSSDIARTAGINVGASVEDSPGMRDHRRS
jgi:hypothetical protein